MLTGTCGPTDKSTYKSTNKSMNILYFYMKGCKTCRRQSEELDRNASGYGIKRVDCLSDEGPALMRRYRVTDVPCIILTNSMYQIVKKWVDYTPFKEIKPYLE